MQKTHKIQGKYYKELSKTLLWSIYIVIFLFSIFSFVFLFQLKENEHRSRELIVQSHFSIIDTAQAIIKNSLKNIEQSSHLETWLETETENEFYFLCWQLQEEIKNTSSQLGALSYSIAILGNRFSNLSISQNGTSSRTWFFEKETNLSSKQIIEIEHHFACSDKPLYLSVYDKQSIISNLYIFHQYTSSSGNKAIIFCKVDTTPLNVINRQGLAFLLDKDKNIISDKNNEEARNLIAKLDTTKPFANTEKVFFKNYTIYINTLTTFSWEYITAFKTISYYNIPIILGWFLFALLNICIIFLVSKKKTNQLYFPFKEIITEQGNSECDEFKIIKNRSHRITTLTQELKEAIEEKETLSTMRYYRNLLEGFAPEDEAHNTDSYFIAIVQFISLTDDNNTFYQKFSLDAYIRTEQNIQYVTFGLDTSVLILKVGKQEEAIHKIKAILVFMGEERETVVAVSDNVIGKQSLNLAYKQALNLLEYSKVLQGKEIITSADIIQINSYIYYYPVNTEKQLVTFILAGNEQALEIFDMVVDENYFARELPKSTLENLNNALLSTLLRAYQELKTTPEDLLRSPISLNLLFSQTKHDDFTTTLRAIIHRTIIAVRETTSASDSQLLSMMENYIQNHFNQNIMLQDLADKFNITPKYCGMLFSRLSNDTFRNYLNSYRIARAKIEIKNNPTIKITTLSELMGFNSSTSFIRVFNKYAGTTPKAYADSIAFIDIHLTSGIPDYELPDADDK
ncbi:MAG: helix-turn-helix domain-containing protein [Sphaerochaeta sp.]